MCCSTRPLRECGQATVEAAFVIPLLFALFGVLLQPALLLYDRCVMGAAAAETCRLASTQPCSEDAMRAFALRRLAVLPPLDLFHSQDCPWEIDVQAGQGVQASQVRISGHVRVLPLLGVAASALTEELGDGCAQLSCSASAQLHPSWLEGVDGSPSDWIATWD